MSCDEKLYGDGWFSEVERDTLSGIIRTLTEDEKHVLYTTLRTEAMDEEKKKLWKDIATRFSLIHSTRKVDAMQLFSCHKQQFDCNEANGRQANDRMKGCSINKEEEDFATSQPSTSTGIYHAVRPFIADTWPFTDDWDLNEEEEEEEKFSPGPNVNADDLDFEDEDNILIEGQTFNSPSTHRATTPPPPPRKRPRHSYSNDVEEEDYYHVANKIKIRILLKREKQEQKKLEILELQKKVLLKQLGQ